MSRLFTLLTAFSLCCQAGLLQAPLLESLLILLSCIGFLARTKGNREHRGKQFPEETCQKEVQDSLGL